jgi:hypothetical protein
MSKLSLIAKKILEYSYITFHYSNYQSKSHRNHVKIVFIIPAALLLFCNDDEKVQSAVH